MIYFPANWGAKEPQNLPNHRVVLDDDNPLLLKMVKLINQHIKMVAKDFQGLF